MQSGSGDISVEAVERALAVVLAREEFASRSTPAWREALARAWDWLGDLLGRLLPSIDPNAPGWALAGRVGLLLLGLVGIGVIVYLGRLLWRAWRMRQRRRAVPEVPAPQPPATVADWEAHAREAAAAGRWRQAVLALYQAILARLAQRGSIRVAAAKTPGDYRRELRDDASAAAALDAFLQHYEPLAFGRGRASPEAYARLKETAAVLGAHG